MFIGAFLAAPLQHAEHPVQSLWSSPGCPLYRQHGWVLRCPMGTRVQGPAHATALLRSHWALRGKDPAAAVAPPEMLTLADCWQERGWPQSLCCRLPPAQFAWRPGSRFAWGHRRVGLASWHLLWLVWGTTCLALRTNLGTCATGDPEVQPQCWCMGSPWAVLALPLGDRPPWGHRGAGTEPH